MNSIAILLATILPFSLSQRVINITEWVFVTDTSTTATSASIIGYDFTNDEIDLIGGSDTANLTARFDPSTEAYITEDSDAPFEIAIQSTGYTQLYGSDTVYFTENPSPTTDPQEIYSVDVSTTPVTVSSVVTTKTAAENQPNAALCMNEAGDVIYSIGRNPTSVGGSNTGEIQAYNITDDAWSVWSGTLASARVRTTCQVYGDTIYVFGGVDKDNVVYNTIDRCSISSETCDDLGTDPMVSERADIESVRIGDVFDGKYVVLIGGYIDGDVATDIVELFNLETEEIYQVASLNTARKYISAVYSPSTQRIFVFNGLDSSDQALDSIETTPLDGIIFTDFPTSDPTDQPTTSEPTTAEPTTSDPTTASPTTAQPTTYEPTDQPSEMPTLEPTTSEPTIATTETTEITDDAYVYDPDIPEYGTSGIAYAILFVILAVICCIIIICFFFYNKEERQYGGGNAAVVPAAVPMVVVAGGCSSCGKKGCDGTQCQSLNANACSHCGQTSCDGTQCR